jgi:hypothetical protein
MNLGWFRVGARGRAVSLFFMLVGLSAGRAEAASIFVAATFGYKQSIRRQAICGFS